MLPVTKKKGYFFRAPWVNLQFAILVAFNEFAVVLFYPHFFRLRHSCASLLLMLSTYTWSLNKFQGRTNTKRFHKKQMRDIKRQKLEVACNKVSRHNRMDIYFFVAKLFAGKCLYMHSKRYQMGTHIHTDRAKRSKIGRDEEQTCLLSVGWAVVASVGVYTSRQFVLFMSFFSTSIWPFWVIFILLWLCAHCPFFLSLYLFSSVVTAVVVLFVIESLRNSLFVCFHSLALD